MKLLEYQGKELFKEYGISIPKSLLARSKQEAIAASQSLGFPLILKSQLYTGGRGKAGAIVKCNNEQEMLLKFEELMNKKVKGELPKSLLLETLADKEKELYLSLFFNRGKRNYTLIASAEGGVEIENVKNKIIIDLPLEGISPEFGEEIATRLNLKNSTNVAFVDFITKLSKLAKEKEAELAEINPLVILSDGSLMALDAKVIIDDNSVFRHPELKKYEDISELELQAKNHGFSFVELDGDMAIIGNGAGLVMSTLDMVSDAGGNAGAFLDFGGKATTESIYQALKVISKIPKIKSILVNLFGGIVRTDLVAQAILDAYNDNTIQVPVFARISGAQSEKARHMLKDSKAKLFETIEEAIKEAVKSTK